MAPPNYEEMLAQWRFPGLNEPENAVAKRWLQEKGGNYDAIEWNVPLGPKIDFGFPMTPEQQAQADFLYASRADIIAHAGDVVTIIEVKRRLTKSAIGQLAHYVYWYRKQHPTTETIIARAIAAYADAGIAESTLANGVDVELYGDLV